jgi:hypothetical protein
VKQKKLSIPKDEMELAAKQAKEEGFTNSDGTANVTGWIRWVIRNRCGKLTEKIAVQA